MLNLKHKIYIGFLTLMVLLAAAPIARAQQIKEIVTQDPSNINYRAALAIMKKSIYLKDAPEYWNAKEKKWAAYPLIRLGSIDLDNDGFDEVIAYPVEMVPAESGQLCKVRGACPHFIFTITDENKVRLLGAMDAYTIRPDDSTLDGYQRLRIYNKNPEKNSEHYELYQYSKKQKQYVRLEY